METKYRTERLISFGMLLVIVLVVHTFYVLVVRPQATAWIAAERAAAVADPKHEPRRSIYVIAKDPEQETTVMLGLWALALALRKAVMLRAQRRQLSADLIRLQPGFRILPEDVREQGRHLEALPAAERDLIVPRTIRRALKRFGETRDVQDAATTVHDYCDSESSRLDSELSPIRFCVWAIPAIGFVGTVRGIGQALDGAQLALRGDTSAVTSGLGVAFNSTLVALMLSILLMYILHEIQLAQERLVLDTELYVDDNVISNFQAR